MESGNRTDEAIKVEANIARDIVSVNLALVLPVFFFFLNLQRCMRAINLFNICLPLKCHLLIQVS